MSGSPIQLRAATRDDAPELHRLITVHLPLLAVRPDCSGTEEFQASVSEAVLAEQVESPRYRFLVAERAGRVVGYIALRDGSHLFHLFVAPADQARGIGRMLWTEAQRQAQLDGPVERFTVNASLNAIPVYEAFGFAAAGTVTQAHGVAYLPMSGGLTSPPAPSPPPTPASRSAA